MIRSGKPLAKVEEKVGRRKEVVIVEEKKKTKQHLSLNRCCCLCSTDAGVWPAAGDVCRGRKGRREVKLSRKERDWMAIGSPFRYCRCMLIPGVCVVKRYLIVGSQHTSQKKQKGRRAAALSFEFCVSSAAAHGRCCASVGRALLWRVQAECFIGSPGSHPGSVGSGESSRGK